MNSSAPDVSVQGAPQKEGNSSEVVRYDQRVDEIYGKVDQIAQKLNDVEQFYLNASKEQNTPKGGSIQKDKGREKLVAGFKRRQQDAARREAAAAKRMQELMRQLGTILRQITQHKWATPFLQPVDVVGLGLHDYYEVIEKPMDFSTIKSKMEAKDGSGYKHIREIYADVRLIFKNAMKYNNEKHDVHVMAKSLLEKFETKWLQLLPKVDEEEKRRKEEEAEAQLDLQLAQEAAHAKMARDLCVELDEVDMQLEELRHMVLQKCRKITSEEKKRIADGMALLSAPNVKKAMELIAENNTNFPATDAVVEVNIDAQSESTLWKLKFFLADALQNQAKSSPSNAGNNDTHENNGPNDNNQNNKRKRDICDALAKASQKKSKKPPN